MPVYFGYTLSGSNKPSAPLRARGINLARAPPSQVRISLVPDVVLLAYTCVVATISRFLLSIATGRPVPIEKCSRIPRLPLTVPFRMPPLVIQLTDNNPGTINSFLALGFESQTVRGKTLLMKDQPTLDDFQTVMKTTTVVRTCFTPYKYVNTDAMMAFLTLRKIATLFLGLDLLPAFNTTTRTVESFTGTTSTPASSATPASDTTTTSTSSSTGFKWSFANATIKGSPDKTPDFVSPSAGSVLTQCWGTLSEVVQRIPTDTTGFFFPYVVDLAKDDDAGPMEFVQRYALRCLGNSPAECFKEMLQIRGGWGHIKTTSSGAHLAHFYRCLEIALQGQSGIACIISPLGRYEGCVIICAGTTLLLNGIASRPLTHNALVAEIQNYNGHDRAAATIASIVDDEDVLSTNAFPLTMADLRTQLLKATLTEKERSQIQDHTPHLDFETDTWGVNPDNLLSFLDVCSTGILPSDAPISYLSLFEPNVALAAITAFGLSSCPSFRIPGGRPLNLRSAMPVAKMIQTMKGRKRTGEVKIDEFEQTIQVQLVNYRQARSDLLDMISDGIIRVAPVGQLGDNTRVYRGANRGALWTALAKAVSTPSGGQGAEVVVSIGDNGLSNDGTIRRDDVDRDIEAYL